VASGFIARAREAVDDAGRRHQRRPGDPDSCYTGVILRHRESLVVVTLLFTVGASALPAAAASSEDPEALIRMGVELRRKGDNARAEVYLRRAYDIASTPRSAAQLGLVELAVERYEEAARYLSEALVSTDLWIVDHRAVIEKSRADARKHLARVEVQGAPPDATVTTSGREPFKLPTDGVLWLTPGVIALRLEATGREPLTYTHTLAAGATDTLVVPRPAPVVAAAPAPVETPVAVTPVDSSAANPDLATTAAPSEGDRGRRARIGGIVVASVGVAAVVTGVVLYQMASTKLNDIQSMATKGAVWDESGTSNWKTLDRAGVAFLVGGGVALAGGAALYLWGRAARAQDSETRVSLVVVPGTQLVALTGAF
jgi:hypothetical protein